MAKRENSKVETSQVVADAIAVKKMGDRSVALTPHGEEAAP